MNFGEVVPGCGFHAEDIADIGERFLNAESVDEIRRWAEEKRSARMQ